MTGIAAGAAAGIVASDVTDFWAGAGPKKWWRKDDQFDADIARRFGGIHMEASESLLDHWADTPDGALALILVLDQFSRNLFRNDPRAFARDDACVALTKKLMESGADRQMRSDIGVFCYLPLMHSEYLEDQDLCLREMERLDLPDNIKAAVEHRDIIEKFGRFPHRNEVLGRTSSAAEQAFLDGGGFSG